MYKLLGILFIILNLFAKKQPEVTNQGCIHCIFASLFKRV